MEKKKVKRDANIELLRIVAMLMVITLHCVGHSGLLGNEKLNTINLILVRFLDSFSATANAIFIIITGYYSISQKINLKRILSLWGKTILYSSLISIICIILGKNVSAFRSFFPVLSGEYWFISAYIAFSFFIPVINIVLNKLSQKQMKYTLIVSILMFSIIRLLFNPTGIFNSALLHMPIIYMIGAYIRKYVEIRPKQKYFIKYVLVTIIFTIVYIILKALLEVFAETNLDLYIIATRTISIYRDFINIFLVIMTVLIFIKFKTISISSSKLSKIITFISPSVFSIYILHENVNIRDTMWSQIGLLNYANSWLLIPYAILMILCVFTVCLLIDLVRRGLYYLLKKISFVNNFVDKVNQKIIIINEKINTYLE